jgi:hypothetical protein
MTAGAAAAQASGPPAFAYTAACEPVLLWATLVVHVAIASTTFAAAAT